MIPLLHALPALAVEQKNLSISAIVPPTASDFQFSLASDYTTVSENTDITYKITYGASESAGLATRTTITARWSDDRAPNQSHILDYVTGSASNAYGNTTPVIDLTNRTITWAIPSLPAGTIDQIITFKLRTNSNYTDLKSFNFTISSSMSNEYISMTDQTNTTTYLYKVPVETPKPTPTSIPNPTPTSIPPLYISDLSFTSLSQSGLTATVYTTKLTKLTIAYGTSAEKLSHTINIDQYSTYHTFTIKDLSPNTVYYMQITASDQAGKKTRSEIFTFQTAQPSDPLQLEQNIATIISNNSLLFSNTTEKNNEPTILLTLGAAFDFTYTTKHTLPIKSIEAVLRNKHVLGANTFSPLQKDDVLTIPMTEKTPGIYIAHMQVPQRGSFELYVRIADTKGNITEQKISNIKVINNLSVYDKTQQVPLPGARVLVSYYNRETNKYEALSPILFGDIKNPNLTDVHGEIHIPIPQGKYRAQVSAFGYKQTSVDFMLSEKDGEDFPTIYLEKTSVFSLSSLENLWFAINDTISKLYAFIKTLSLSLQFFHVLAYVILFSFIVITLVLFTFRTHISFLHLPTFFLHHLERLFNKKISGYISGAVTDDEHTPLTRVRIECIDHQTGNILTHIDTHKNGSFYFKDVFGAQTIKLLVTRDGYLPQTILLEGEHELTNIQITLHKGNEHKPLSLFSYLITALETIAGFLFEISLLISLLFELLFFSLFGIAQTLPFFCISFLNIILWVFFLKEKKKRAK